MEEIGKGLKTIFDRIADFFDIFDLSFFVAGIGTGSAFIYLYYLNYGHFELPGSSAFLKALLIIIFFYILGLVSFAFGRFLRVELFSKYSSDKMNARLLRAIKVHGLDENELYKKYLEAPPENRGAWRLYVRLWSKLRDEPKLTNSFTQVKRYWVMSATYDGVVLSLLTWAVTIAYLVFFNKNLVDIDPWPGSVFIVLLLAAVFLCIREAQRNLMNQVDEIIAIAADSFNDDL